MKIIALILAAGRGTRAGGVNPKQWQHLGNKRIIDHSIDLFKDISRINNVMVVLHPDDLPSELLAVPTTRAEERHPALPLV